MWHRFLLFDLLFLPFLGSELQGAQAQAIATGQTSQGKRHLAAKGKTYHSKSYRNIKELNMRISWDNIHWFNLSRKQRIETNLSAAPAFSTSRHSMGKTYNVLPESAGSSSSSWQCRNAHQCPTKDTAGICWIWEPPAPSCRTCSWEAAVQPVPQNRSWKGLIKCSKRMQQNVNFHELSLKFFISGKGLLSDRLI